MNIFEIPCVYSSRSSDGKNKKKASKRVDTPEDLLRFSYLYIHTKPPLSKRTHTFSLQIVLGKRSKRSTTVANPSRSRPPPSLSNISLPSPLASWNPPPHPPPLSEDSIAFDSGSQRYEKDQDSFLYTSWLGAK
ncbi:hypothetical protein AVEN_265466-1 [Araneus ventricosus]|uniref:Uncharacterized protein n=1 Tax=Araneus ventricosus TaxID=182803 RepID=A0A4Y2CHQ1_ARAVE|nr:hypothetical protein AVEN_265466-1 [Araneus ventricosus]